MVKRIRLRVTLKIHRLSLFLGALAKLRKAIISFVIPVRLSVCPHGITRPPTERILMKSDDIRRENSNFIKI